MKICLVFPRSIFLEDPMVFPPLGLWYLWPILERAGHEVSFIDMSQDNLAPTDLPRGYDVYLVSGTSPQAQEIRAIGKVLATRGDLAILGGPHATNYPRGSRKYYPVVVRREGEPAVLKAIELALSRDTSLLTGDDLRRATDKDYSILTKLNQGIVEVPLMSDLGMADIPNRSRALDYHYYLEDENGIKHRATTMFTSRGCPMCCDFCDSPNLWSRKVRLTPLDKVFAEYAEIKSLGFTAIQYYDDILPLNPTRIKEMCREMKRLGFIWRGFGRTDILSNHGGKDYLQFMYDHGLRELLIGVESGSQRILDNVHKGTIVAQNAQVVRWCDEVGIRCKLSLIIGLPGETSETLQETQKFLRDLLINQSVRVKHKVDLCAYIPMTGTPIHKAVARRKGSHKELKENSDSYGYHLGEDNRDFDIDWDVDAALLDNFFYASEVLGNFACEEIEVDEIFYKGRRGSVRQIVRTKALSQAELTKFRAELEDEVRKAGFSY
jgi:anaerobic magnesium-protoporphyrin IX monomethyl ester cyclase